MALPCQARETARASLDRLVGDDKPEVLLQIELFVEKQLHAVDTLKGPKDGWGRVKLRADVYRQALDMFIASQTLHKPLLIRIKAAYEQVLRDALQMAYDHIQLKQLLSVTLKQGDATVERARQAAADDAEGIRLELQDALAAAEAEAAAVEARANSAEDQLSSYTRALNAAQREVEALATANRHTHAELLAATSWAGLMGPPEQRRLTQQQRSQQRREEEPDQQQQDADQQQQQEEEQR